MFPEPTELLLMGGSIESIQNPNQIYIDTNSQTCLPRKNLHVTSGIIFLCLFDISHFSCADCSEGMAKRTRKDSGDERVTAKSRPMMNLIARSSERAPSALSFSASESPGKTRQESQSLLSAQGEICTIERWDLLFALSEERLNISSLKTTKQNPICR